MTKRTECLQTELEVLDWVKNGMTIAIGEPHPMALIRQIIRRGVRDLTIICSGLGLDHLIAAGCVTKTISYYAGGGAGVPVVPSFRGAAERSEIEVWECEEGILTTGLEAAAKGLPFLPWRGGVGTSLTDVNTDLKLFKDPIEGETLIAVPAIKPDITILHAAQSDAYGYIQHHGGPGWLDLFLARAADKVVVQVEKVVSNDEIRANPWATTIEAADAVVYAPWGAHPFYSRGYYLQDVPYVRDYLAHAEKARTGEPSGLQSYLDKYCVIPKTHVGYLETIGTERLLSLREF